MSNFIGTPASSASPALFTIISLFRIAPVCEGIVSGLSRKKQQNRRSKIIDGEKEAYLIALACSETPMGQAKWTLQMLADKMIELQYVEKVSRETIRKTLKKTN